MCYVCIYVAAEPIKATFINQFKSFNSQTTAVFQLQLAYK